MISKIKVTFLFIILLSAMGANQLNAQNKDDNKVTIKITYEDKDGMKQTETKELVGKYAEDFDLEKYKTELEEKGMKLLTLYITKNKMKSKLDDLHMSKDDNVFIKKKGSDDQDLEKEIEIIREEGDEESKFIIKELDYEYEDGKMMKKVEVIALGDDMEEKEIEVEVKDGKVYINGKEVEKGEIKDEQKAHRIVIRTDKDEDDHELEIKKWISKDGETIELHGDDHEMIFISEDDGKPRLGIFVEDGKEVNGAEVLDIVEDSPAAKAGLQKGDVITSIDGNKVYGVTSLLARIVEIKGGEEAKVVYMRNGKEMKADILLEKLSKDHKMMQKKVIKKIKER